jgi:adenosylcobyric acid synthase
LSWAARLEDLEADLVVLPGSKHVAADLRWLRERHLDQGVLARVAAGLPVLAICGGMQMLGARLVDAGDVDGDAVGLGLLPLETTFAATKIVSRIETRFDVLAAPWASLTGRSVSGYEIRHGESVAVGPVISALPSGRGFAAGSVLSVSFHGLFENPGVVAALAGRAPDADLDDVFEELADAIEAALDVSRLLREAGLRHP